MRVTIVPRTDLDQQQIEHLSGRAAAPEHTNDNGPLKAWDQPANESKLYAVTVAASPMPIGILYANLLESELEVGWWIDIEWRSKKFGRPAVVAFAELLKSKYPNFMGPIRARIITFGGRYDDASRALSVEFERHFRKENASQLALDQTLPRSRTDQRA